MGAFKARSRLVSFRLTHDELADLRAACLKQGARTVSAFARGAALELAETRARPETLLLHQFSALELRLAEIQSGIRHNGDLLRAVMKSLTSYFPDRPREKAKGA
jgi:hypothetical protein